GARLAARLCDPAREEGLPADERQLRAAPAARASPARAGQEAGPGGAGAGRSRAVAGERPDHRRAGAVADRRVAPPGAGGGPVPPGAGRPTVAAVIDVGSNSVLLLTVAVDGRGRARAIDEALATTRLGTGLVGGGRLDAPACTRTREAVVGFAARARQRGAIRAWAFGTAAMRDAVDGSAFARDLEAAASVPVEVLSAESEARLAYAAVVHGLGVESGATLVADVGGRSTELTLGRGERVAAAESLPLGALALTEASLRGDPPDRVEARRLMD